MAIQDLPIATESSSFEALVPAVGGSEASTQRPVVIGSNANANANANAARLGRGVLTVVPVTSNVERASPFQVLLPSGAAGLPRDGRAQAEQVRPVAAERLGTLIGRPPAPLVAPLDDALRVHLALSRQREPSLYGGERLQAERTEQRDRLRVRRARLRAVDDEP